MAGIKRTRLRLKEGFRRQRRIEKRVRELLLRSIRMPRPISPLTMARRCRNQRRFFNHQVMVGRAKRSRHSAKR
ncbi:hypothetical protein KCP69_08765 [Salmonella enterica subsp. enterica]|nr:hypothetical protein KCP69_08765 [Salmonella enterica subsp. enterica]